VNISLILITGILVAFGSASPDAWWVFFSDRGPGLEDRLEAESLELMSSPSYERRLSAGLLCADELDLEPWSGYVNQIADSPICVAVRTSSRFLNAVSVRVTDGNPEEFLRLPFVERVQPVSSSDFSIPVFTPAPGMTAAGLTAAQLDQIGMDELHERGWTGSGVTVGILDSGFNLTHEVFNSISVVEMYDFVNDDSDPSQQPGDPPGQSDHGTAVLSIMGGYVEDTFYGGVHDASFILAKTEDISDEFQAEEDYWVQGLEWIESNGGDIVSSSLAYIDWYTYQDLDGNTAVTTIAADAAASRGMAVFNSVGNNGPDQGTLLAPSDGDSVFAVGGVDFYGNVTEFSSRGPTYDGRIKPDGCALGQNVTTAFQGTSTYSLSNGTSFATPLVSSAAAALSGAHPEWSMMEIIQILHLTASRSCSPDNNIGYGIVNAFAALKYSSVTGSVRYSRSGSFIPSYPLMLEIDGSTFAIETNSSGWFAFCPGELGEFSISDGGGPGSVIPVSGLLTAEGVEVEVFVDQTPCSAAPSVFPNPSTQGVYVGFDLASGPVDVEMTVFDITGQAVFESVRSDLGPGSFRAPLPDEAFYWDGMTADGSSAASGVYIVSLKTGDDVHLMKCSLVR
jgi:hypothetical protein